MRRSIRLRRFYCEWKLALQPLDAPPDYMSSRRSHVIPVRPTRIRNLLAATIRCSRAGPAAVYNYVSFVVFPCAVVRAHKNRKAWTGPSGSWRNAAEAGQCAVRSGVHHVARTLRSGWSVTPG